MGLRFRKGIRLAPGIRLNLSKSGLSSLSIGGKGLTYNIGKKGTRATGGLPGTGLSYSKYMSYGKTQETTQQHIDRETGEITETKTTTTSGGIPWPLVLIMALVVGAVYLMRS